MVWYLIKVDEHGKEEERYLCTEPKFHGVIQKRIITIGVEVHPKTCEEQT